MFNLNCIRGQEHCSLRWAIYVIIEDALFYLKQSNMSERSFESLMFYFTACVKVLNLVTIVLMWPTKSMCSGVYLAYFSVCRCTPMENPWGLKGSWWVTVKLSLVIKTRSSFHHRLCRVPHLQDSIIYIVISTKYEFNVFSFWHWSVCKWMDLNVWNTLSNNI